MRFVDLMLDPGLMKNPGEVSATGHPGRRLSVVSHHFAFDKSLDQCGALKIEMLQAPMANVFANGKNTPDKPPHDITIFALVCDDSGDPNSLKEIPFFKGILHRSSIHVGFSDFVTLTYIDPLVATYEQDGPEEFHDRDLKSIFTKILSNSFKKGQIQPIFKTPVPNGVRTTNRELTDFDFIKGLSKEYGLHFYYRPNNQNHEVVFFQPDYSKKASQTIKFERLNRPVLSTNHHDFLDAIVAHDFAGKEFKVKADSFPEGGPGLKQRLQSRQQTGIELISHVHYPNASTAQTIQLKAKAKFMNSLWANQTLSFGSSSLLELGELFEVTCKEGEHPIQGTYLLKSVRLTGKDNHLSLQYEGVRP